MESIVYVVSVGAGAAVAAIVGQSLGAGDVVRARRAGWSAVRLVSVLGMVMALVTLLFPEQLAGIFSTDAAVVNEAAHYLRIAAFSQLFLGTEVVLESAMGGAGWTLALTAAARGVLMALLWASGRWQRVAL